mmetsp:Transcript_39478/g.101318  ORF Transcript_39478/g.101318 Transcript_39478/m.101318 type:complete len:86 (+) Transcript_39478:190-447(+)
MSRVRVLFFASARDATEKKEEEREIAARESTTLRDLLDQLCDDYPSLRPVLDSCAVAVNEEVVEHAFVPLHGGDEVAILPPVSGG